MTALEFVVGALAVWRVTHLLQAEDGPFELVTRLRRSVGSGGLGELLDCFYCLSLWISAPLALWMDTQWRERVLLWLSLSAAAILLNRAVEALAPERLHYIEAPSTDAQEES
jgi:hypothetical protein